MKKSTDLEDGALKRFLSTKLTTGMKETVIRKTLADNSHRTLALELELIETKGKAKRAALRLEIKRCYSVRDYLRRKLRQLKGPNA